MWSIQDFIGHSAGSLAVFLIVFLSAVGIVAIAAAGLLKRVFRLGQDNRAPRLTVEATVTGRRQEDRFYGTKYRKTRVRAYYADFLLTDGARIELWMGRRKYRRMAADSFGILTYQGRRLIRFEPKDKL